ncbi:hypothetical protein ROHU_008478 [Labeo rohita]|uniref:Uncharacterized protein n=1 Tax=Labeo rohita TaxID=84645 RepID=A0A498MEX0_LABRO|nr:hypothetical protein ROHU_008478 [Labeo rohita]
MALFTLASVKSTGKFALSVGYRRRRGRFNRKTEIFFHLGDDVLEEYEVTITLSEMRRALLGHIPETRIDKEEENVVYAGITARG